MEEFMALYGDAPFDTNSSNSWFGFANTAAGTAAFISSRSNGSVRLIKRGKFSPKYYTSGWAGGSRARIVTHSLAKWGIKLGRGVNITGSLYTGAEFLASNKTWGDYGRLGVSGLSASLSALPEPVTTVFGLSIGYTDAAGGFDDFYNFLDVNQSFYNSTGRIYIPNY